MFKGHPQWIAKWRLQTLSFLSSDYKDHPLDWESRVEEVKMWRLGWFWLTLIALHLCHVLALVKVSFSSSSSTTPYLNTHQCSTFILFLFNILSIGNFTLKIPYLKLGAHSQIKSLANLLCEHLSHFSLLGNYLHKYILPVSQALPAKLNAHAAS